MSARTVIAAVAILVILAAAAWLTVTSGPCLRGEHMGARVCERDR